jgi:hypothetical protein
LPSAAQIPERQTRASVQESPGAPPHFPSAEQTPGWHCAAAVQVFPGSSPQRPLVSQTPLRHCASLVQGRELGSPQRLSPGSQTPLWHSSEAAAAVQVATGIGWPLGVLVTQVPWPLPPPLHHSDGAQFASTSQCGPQVPVRYVSQTAPLWVRPEAVSAHWLEEAQVPQEPSGAQYGEADVRQACAVPVPKSPSQATQVSNEAPALVEQIGVAAPQAPACVAVHCSHLFRFTEPRVVSQTPALPVQAAVLLAVHWTQTLADGSQTGVALGQLASTLQVSQRPALGPVVTQRSPRHCASAVQTPPPCG